MPETITIEALCVRAYREKRMDRLPANAARQVIGLRGPAALGAGPLARGERVDTSSWGATAEARSRETLRRFLDAGDGLLALHDAVLALDDYYVEDLDTPDGRFALWTRDGALEAGQWIDATPQGTGGTIQAARVSREATAEGESVRVTPLGEAPRVVARIVIAPLIVLAGRAAEPPFVSPLAVPTKGRRRGLEAAMPRDLVVRERGEYAAWHHALTALAEHLAGIVDFHVTPPVSPARPWEGPGAIAA